MKIITHIFALFILLAFMSGCYFPEQFDAKVIINKDGSYTFTYDGTLSNMLVLAAAKDKALSVKDEEELKKETASFTGTPGFKKAEYQGKGRYKVLFEKTCKKGEPLYFFSKEMNYISIVPQKDGTISVNSFRPSAKDIAEFKSIGAKVDGKLFVKPARGIKVVQSNAQTKPKFFGLIGGYSWQIKSPEEPASIVLKP